MACHCNLLSFLIHKIVTILFLWLVIAISSVSYCRIPVCSIANQSVSQSFCLSVCLSVSQFLSRRLFACVDLSVSSSRVHSFHLLSQFFNQSISGVRQPVSPSFLSPSKFVRQPVTLVRDSETK